MRGAISGSLKRKLGPPITAEKVEGRGDSVSTIISTFPAEHWKHIRTTNPIESTFATVRHRTTKTKGCLSRQTALAMTHQLMLSAKKNGANSMVRTACRKVTARLAPPARSWGDRLRHVHSDVVNDVSYTGLAMRGDILGLERRRRWSDDEKLEIVMSVGLGDATVTQVAQRHDVTRQQIYAWRHELKKKGLLSACPEALFLPVELDRPMELSEQTAVMSTVAPRAAQIELQLANGRCLRFDQGVDAATLMQLIRAVEAA